VACGGGMSASAADQQVAQLITLYKENREKFVIQKQEIQDEKGCGRAKALREAIERKEKAAAMSPDKTDDITMVRMELVQAAEVCASK